MKAWRAKTVLLQLAIALNRSRAVTSRHFGCLHQAHVCYYVDIKIPTESKVHQLSN